MILMTRYGFIEFDSEEAVGKAIKEMNGRNIWGDGKITVESAFIKQRVDGESWSDMKQREREEAQRENEIEKRVKNVRCYRCDATGHLAQECPGKKRSKYLHHILL